MPGQVTKTPVASGVLGRDFISTQTNKHFSLFSAHRKVGQGGDCLYKGVIPKK